MASIVAQGTWPDGTTLMCQVEYDDLMPDAIQIAREHAVVGFLDMLAGTVAEDD